jgi:hypothetical protein
LSGLSIETSVDGALADSSVGIGGKYSGISFLNSDLRIGGIIPVIVDGTYW